MSGYTRDGDDLSLGYLLRGSGGPRRNWGGISHPLPTPFSLPRDTYLVASLGQECKWGGIGGGPSASSSACLYNFH